MKGLPDALTWQILRLRCQCVQSGCLENTESTIPSFLSARWNYSPVYSHQSEAHQHDEAILPSLRSIQTMQEFDGQERKEYQHHHVEAFEREPNVTGRKGLMDRFARRQI